MELPGVVADQSGVVARQQLLAGGWTDADIRRARRRRELVAVLPGVFVDHTGTPTWMQRAWVAVLATSTFDGGVRGGSPLAQESALRVADGAGALAAADGIRSAPAPDCPLQPASVAASSTISVAALMPAPD